LIYPNSVLNQELEFLFWVESGRVKPAASALFISALAGSVFPAVAAKSFPAIY
jgi:hypothetical protein